jgi:hypothetical protein
MLQKSDLRFRDKKLYKAAREIQEIAEKSTLFIAEESNFNKICDEVDPAIKPREKEPVISRLIYLVPKKELENKALTQEDYDFIKNFGKQLKAVIKDVDEKAQKTTIIADVHTDGNSKQVLEEGVGYVDLIVVAYKVPDGRILVGAGPVMSYYEFKQPMSDRLTDEKWREILSQNPPVAPEWVSSFRT